MKNKKNIHHVFCTVGLDSSFRIISLLRTTNELILPHYVIRHETSNFFSMIKKRFENKM